MSSDDEKTVFRQPAAPGDGDRTVIRPKPGGRGAGAPPPQAPVTPQQPMQSPAQQAPAYAPPVMDTQAAYFRITQGLNPLVNAASTLIAVFEKTRHTMSHADVGGLHQRLVNEIKNFEQRAREQGIKPEIVLSARYVLCTALDEAVLNTPWGSESAWTQRTLLSVKSFT
jgi:type VI secretion system protein ImpK